LEIVHPSESVLAEPHVAVVDRVVDRKGTRVVAEAYLNFLHEIEAQEIIAKHYYRPTHPLVKKQTASQFPQIKLFEAIPLLGPGWDEIQKRYFAEGGVFDQIRVGRRHK